MPKLEDIYRFYEIDEHLATGGQPTIEQFPTIKSAGYTVVINLGAGETKYDIHEEPEIVANLGIHYHNIPVDWENPQAEDIDEFFSLMEENSDEKIFVHCIANYRVAAFVMLYRVIKRGVPLHEAKASKNTVWKRWRIYPKWNTFIKQTLARYGNEDS